MTDPSSTPAPKSDQARAVKLWLADLTSPQPRDPLALVLLWYHSQKKPKDHGAWVAARKTLLADLSPRGLSLLEKQWAEELYDSSELDWLLKSTPLSQVALSRAEDLLLRAGAALAPPGSPRAEVGPAAPLLEVFPCLQRLLTQAGPEVPEAEVPKGAEPPWDPPASWEAELGAQGWSPAFLSLRLSDGTDLRDVINLPAHIVRPDDPRAAAPAEVSRLKAKTQGCFGWLDERDPACAACELVLMCAAARHHNLLHLDHQLAPPSGGAPPQDGPQDGQALWADPRLDPSRLNTPQWDAMSAALLKQG